MVQEITGQEALIKYISRIFEIFKTSNCELRPHFILTGESGSDKSTIKTLCDVFELNYLEINAAQITKEGTAGNSISKALLPLFRMSNIIPTVVFVDEFDKLFISGNSNSQLASEFTTEVQNEFLKVLESEITSVYDNANYVEYANAVLKHTLFVFAGAFNNEPNITLDRLRDFGVKTEFLERVGLVYNTTTIFRKFIYYFG